MLTEKEKDLVLDITAWVKKHYPELDIEIEITDFAQIFQRQQGIQAMHNFIAWCQRHSKTVPWVLETLLHDINDRKEEFMVPRTMGYLNVIPLTSLSLIDISSKPKATKETIAAYMNGETSCPYCGDDSDGCEFEGQDMDGFAEVFRCRECGRK